MTFLEETPANTENTYLKLKLKKPENPEFAKSKDVYQNIIKEATFIDGNQGELCSADDIPWLENSLINSGMEIYEKHFAAYVGSTILCMLTLAVAVKPISTTIFCNNKPLDVDHYFGRFLGKCRGIMKFFELLKDPVEGKRIFYKTRKMHAIAVRRLENLGNGRTLPEILVRTEKPWMQETVNAIKEDIKELENDSKDNENIPSEITENLSWETKVPFSQFGHVYFTTGFFGFVWLHPQLFGMKDRNDKRMKGFIHIWAVIVKMLGLRDEFNIYINPDPEVIDRVIREVYVYSLKSIDTVVIFLEQTVVQGINNHFPLLTVKGSLCLAMKALGCNKMSNLWKIMSVKDKIVYYGISGLFFLGTAIPSARHILNWWFRNLIESLFVKVLGKYE